jgi:hypothetical protein
MNAQTLSSPRILQSDTWPVRLSLILAGLFAWVQSAASGLVGNDGYYHLKMAALMRGDLTLKFIWLPLTILNPAEYVNHHWLFHILLMPFAGGDLITGGRMAAVVFAAAAIFVAGWLLRSQGVPHATLWAVLIFAASSAFVYRMSMPRTQSLSLLWILVAVYLLLRRHDFWLVLLGMTYVWLYDAFPLLLIVGGVYVIAARITEGQWRWAPLFYSVLGICLGLVINPYFPHNLTFIYHHLIAKLDLTNVPVGNEWYPYTTAQLLSNSGLALLAFVGGTFALGWSRQRITLPTALMFGLSIVFGIMLMQSRRFVEYFPPFAVMFCAFACQPILSGRAFRWQAATAAVAAVILAATLTARDARDIVADDTPADQFAGASQWLETHTPEGSLVFQTDWDDFTRLFFHNTHNVYTVGLDPTYLQRADPTRYTLWVDITQGRGLDVSDAIRKQFGADYVVSDLKHKAFLARATDDPQLKEVYRDENSVVFAVLGN